jgi:hypothetical protein
MFEIARPNNRVISELALAMLPDLRSEMSVSLKYLRRAELRPNDLSMVIHWWRSAV